VRIAAHFDTIARIAILAHRCFHGGALQQQAFAHTRYLVRRKVFTFFGGKFHVYDPNGQLVAFSKMKAFKFKEDIRLYTDESMSTELLVIQARQIIDWGASYDVYDPQQRVKVGALRRKGWKSIMKDEWIILDPSDRQIGLITEESTFKAVVRRFVEVASMFMPQRYNVTVGGQQVAYFKQNFNPFVFKLNVDISEDGRGLLDRRIGLAAALLMAAIEGRQG
jgi:hypothetical protein